MYGSNFCIVILYPLACKSLPIDEDIIPFPSDETTPPVTNIYLVSATIYCININNISIKRQLPFIQCAKLIIIFK